MQLRSLPQHLGALVLAPLTRNTKFFVFMYALGTLSAVITTPPGKTMYADHWTELFVDLFVLCALLALLPRMVRRWTRRLVAAVLYGVALADAYCFVRYGSTLTPTMLMLVGETDPREAGEFFGTVLTADTVLSPVGWMLLLLLVHLLTALRLRFPHTLPHGVQHALWRVRHFFLRIRPWSVPTAGVVVLAGFVTCAILTWPNKVGVHKLMTARTIGETEHLLTRADHGVNYLPIHRLAFSLRANALTAQQLTRLRAAARTARVDSVAYTSPNIILIIGESYNRHHSQQYGYFQKTTPRQCALERRGRLIKFSDVVTPWNLTSYVFKNVLSMHAIGQKGEWCDYPLFPQLFRAAGYHVTFLTNQFLPRQRDAVYDFSGGFFLNDATLSEAMFDTRNKRLHDLDEGLLEEWDNLAGQATDHNLVIFHLLGQHVNYKQRSPKNRKRFHADDYREAKPHLNDRERGILADYDNAILYNDSIVDQIVRRFDDREAIVIYVPDHGEECFEDGLHFFCRLHSARITRRLARAEFDIPFWMWVSRKYARRHPDVVRAIRQAKDRRFMTDALSHTLLGLAGIASPSYDARYDLLSPEYDEQRPRLLKGKTDYDKL